MFGKPSACEINNSVRVPPQAALRSSGAARPSGQPALVSGLDWKGLAPDKRRRTADTWLYPLILAWSRKSHRRASDRTGGSSCLFFCWIITFQQLFCQLIGRYMSWWKGGATFDLGIFGLALKFHLCGRFQIKARKKKKTQTGFSSVWQQNKMGSSCLHPVCYSCFVSALSSLLREQMSLDLWQEKEKRSAIHCGK